MEDAVWNYGARFIDFEDENLSHSKKWFLSLLDAIFGKFGNERLELRAMNGLFPPTLDEEVVMAMKKAGFKTLNLSLGATCRRQLRRFRRPDVRSAFDQCLSLAEKYGLDAVGYIICGAPGQNPEQSVKDLLYLAQRRVLAGLSVFYPAPGSRDYETSKTLGILPEKASLFRSSTIPISHSTSRLQSITLMRLSRIVNFIKQLADKGKVLPSPANLMGNEFFDSIGREQLGEILLSGFLSDGHIRGMTPDRQMYRHFVDINLSRYFLSHLASTTIKGSGRILN
jgi:hypothetical protein